MFRPRHNRLRRERVCFAFAFAAAAALLLWAAPASAQTTFPAGSIIIPTSSPYQDACGMPSVYGLIYDILRADDGIASYPVSGSAFTSRITVHWVYSGNKGSPNRCVPTNVSAVYAGATAVTPAPASNDPTWNDGCDIIIDGSASNSTPATQVAFHLGSSNTQDIVTLDTVTGTGSDYVDPSGLALSSTTMKNFVNALAFPNFLSVTANAANGVNVMRYGGGAFVISASDVPALIEMLSSLTPKFQDSSGNYIDFSAYATNNINGNEHNVGHCSVKTATPSGTTVVAAFGSNDNDAGVGSGLNYANTHRVNIHQALLPFTADDSSRMNGRPPVVALLQSTGGCYLDERGVVHGKTGATCFTSSMTGVKGTQLQYYLKSAGLDFPSAGGCPANAFNLNNTAAGNSALCPIGADGGQIFDMLDVADIAGGALSNGRSDGGGYQVLWAPHFEPGPAKSCYTDCMDAGLQNIATFMNQPNHGVMAECASIETFEGANDGGGNYPTPMIDGRLQSLACLDGGAGICSTTIDTTALNINNGFSDVRLNNCTDPTTTAGGSCIQYPAPGNAFAQIGDFRWYAFSGVVQNYFPEPGAIYGPGVLPLAYTIGTLTKSLLTSASSARTMAKVDNFTYIQRGNNSQKAQMVYLGGHNYTSDVAGTRVALNTLLALGLVLTTSETAYIGPTLYQSNVFVPTYREVTNVTVPAEWRVLNVTLGSKWHFPYHQGDLRIHPLQTSTVNETFATDLVASASDTFGRFATKYATNASPVTAATRNLFTYLDGHVDTESGGYYTGNVIQHGWMPVNFDVPQVTPTTCLDMYHVGNVALDAGLNKPGPYAGMVQGPNTVAGANGQTTVCDLQEALEVNLTATDIGADYGASAADQTQIANVLTDPEQLNKAMELVQMVRGYCFATTSGLDSTIGDVNAVQAHPTDAQCNDLRQYGTDVATANLSSLGGFVHSQVAVIPDTPYVANIGGKARPTVAYAGALDGQLHAFYVTRSDGADVGYTGPVSTVGGLNPSAATVFPRTLSLSSPPANLTELWSFIPPGQLPYLASNSAAVDSSPAVIDVFGNFSAAGIAAGRSWHTVLVASAGGNNQELFALDITNPLAPTLLWDLQSTYGSSLAYAPVPLTDDDTGLTTDSAAVGSTDYALQWQNNCRASATGCTPALYQLPTNAPTLAALGGGPAPDPGLSTSGPYNYRHLGASQSVSVAAMRRNGQPVFAAFVATNEPRGNGVYVFSIDIVTGQKLWEWASPYDTVSMPAGQASGVGNTPPAGVTLLSKAGNNLIDTVYVGDDTGNLWELDAATGVSLTSYATSPSCATAPATCNFSLSNAYGYTQDGGPQPISTLSTLFFIPTSQPAGTTFFNYAGQTMLAYGTAGTDTVSALPVVPNGAIHVIPLAASGRYQATDLAITGDKAIMTAKGVGKEPSGYPQWLTGGKRVFGSIVATNDQLYFSGTSGTVTDIDKRGDASALNGTTYSLNLLSTSTSTAISPLSGYLGVGGIGGTVAVSTNTAGQVTVVTVTTQGIATTVVPSTNNTAAEHSINNVGLSPTSMLGWIIRQTGHDY